LNLEKAICVVFFLGLLETAARVGGLNFLFVDGAELGEGVDGIVGAIAADALVFALVENLNLGGAVGLGENLWFGFVRFERNLFFGGIYMPAGRTG